MERSGAIGANRGRQNGAAGLQTDQGCSLFGELAPHPLVGRIAVRSLFVKHRLLCVLKRGVSLVDFGGDFCNQPMIGLELCQ